MKCDICGKEILYKKDLVAGPLNRAQSISIGAIMGRNIQKFHKSCLKNLPAKEKLYSRKILPMTGGYGKAIIILPIILFAIVFVIVFLTKLLTSGNLAVVAVFLIVLIIGFEIPLIRLRQKIKTEYEDKLQ